MIKRIYVLILLIISFWCPLVQATDNIDTGRWVEIGRTSTSITYCDKLELQKVADKGINAKILEVYLPYRGYDITYTRHIRFLPYNERPLLYETSVTNLHYLSISPPIETDVWKSVPAKSSLEDECISIFMAYETESRKHRNQ